MTGEWAQIEARLREEMGYPDLSKPAHYQDQRPRSIPVQVKIPDNEMPDVTKAQALAVVVFIVTAVYLALPWSQHVVEICALSGTLIAALTGSDAVHRRSRNQRIAEENSAAIHATIANALQVAEDEDE